MKNIRNFSIIAHIDHGKSTLAARLIQACNTLISNNNKIYALDSMDLERERGITIKAHSVVLKYKAYNGQFYQLNFIDTPGHVDFSYEVSRSLAACEGAVLLVDASKGIEAQTLATCHSAIKMNLRVMPVLNKVDLLSAEPDRVAWEIEKIIGINAVNAVRCSAKTGLGISEVLERIVSDIPAPYGNPGAPLQALIIDSWFDNYQGIISLIRVKNGTLHKGAKIKIMSTGQLYNAEQLGIFTPKCVNREVLNCGEVGWLACAIKNIYNIPVGDTITLAHYPANKALSGFEKVSPKVYAGMFPVNSKDYNAFRSAISKLSLNDASLFYEPESSTTLGFGFRCGFLGLLHMDIIQERLEREYNITIIKTAPTVIYEVITKNNSILHISNPVKLPSLNNIAELREPIVECHILLPKIYLGNAITLCTKKRGIQIDITYYDNQVKIVYEIPMSEVILDFFDKLKSVSHGYASLDYKFKRFQKSDVVRVDILINNKRIDALAFMSCRDNASYISRKFIDKLQQLVPRQQFNVVIQASIGKHIIARSMVKQLRKNVIAKCYGGDVSRKKKLLQNQKKGKKRMKNIGNITLPNRVLLELLYTAKNKQ